jgi:hypothetical protein
MIFVLRREGVVEVVWEVEKSDELRSRLNGSDDHEASWTRPSMQLDLHNDFHDWKARPEARVSEEAPMEGSCLVFKHRARSGKQYRPGHKCDERATSMRLHLSQDQV